jgi:hypothetical protein
MVECLAMLMTQVLVQARFKRWRVLVQALEDAQLFKSLTAAQLLLLLLPNLLHRPVVLVLVLVLVLHAVEPDSV